MKIIAKFFIRRFYWSARNIQDCLVNIAMCIGSSLNFEAPPKGSRDFAITCERYINLIHFVCHIQTSPVLRDIGWNQMQVSMNDFNLQRIVVLIFHGLLLLAEKIDK